MGMEEVVTACELALEEKTLHLPAIVNLIHRLQKHIERSAYPKLQALPLADYQRYERLRHSVNTVLEVSE